METESASYETKDEALASDPQFVRFWLDALTASGDTEKNWRKDATEVVEIYRGDGKDGTASEFNILYSNIETLLPAIYNSTPSPDVRRRFGDKDPIAKTISDILERSVSYSLDSYDFDSVMRGVLFDASVPGRGVARVRYVPYMDESGQSVDYEEATCEYVPWKHFRHGAARIWDEVPWVAFEHFLSRDQLRKLNPKLADKVQLDCTTGGEDDGEQKSDILKRARVWEIWDKDAKEVVFIATGLNDEALKREKDPLELTGFFPNPRPVQPIMTPGNLVPVTTYTAYRSLAEELNSVTGRIKKLIRQLRVRGMYAMNGEAIKAITDADDGDLVPVQGVEMFVDKGGLDNAIAWWPIEPTVKALVALREQREAIKQTIYEVTGISDIVRGQSAASETATAQNIKQQWGSLRIQRLQAEVQRFARDLFRLKAEIFATKFSMQTLSMITSVPLLPTQQIEKAKQAIQQAQQAQQPPPPGAEDAAKAAPLEEVEKVLRSDLMRAYRVDVESDSTIRADLTKNQQQMVGFMQGSAQFFAAAVPAQQAGVPAETFIEIYTAFARQYKLGKQAEDALDRLGEQAREAAKQPKQPKPDPEMEKAKAQIGLEQQRMQMEGQIKAKEAELKQAELQHKQALAQADLQLQQEKAAAEVQLKREIAQMQMQLDQWKANADMQMKHESAQKDHELRREKQGAETRMGRERQILDYKAKGVKVPNVEAGDDAEPDDMDKQLNAIEQSVGQIGQAVVDVSQTVIQVGQMVAELQQQASAPKRVVRDRAGNVVGVETGGRVQSVARDESGRVVGLQ